MLNIASDNFDLEELNRRIDNLELTGQSYIETYCRFEDYYEAIYTMLKSIDTEESRELLERYKEYKQSKFLSNEEQLIRIKEIAYYLHMVPELIA